MFLLNFHSVAGAGAYVFAKRSINADRKSRHEEERQRRMKAQMRLDEVNPPPPAKAPRKRKSVLDSADNPSSEASTDPAPTRHAPYDDEQKVREKSKYSPTEPYRSKKGDRFS